MTYEAGALVAQRFVIERVAGEGGSGRVYRALDRSPRSEAERTHRDDVVALKIFHAGAGAFSTREARMLLELAHPNIVRCVAFGKTDAGEDFIATEWVSGETLRDRIARGPLNLVDTLNVARSIADGLAAAHAWGIVHRDVTPANIVLVEGAARAHTMIVKLLDFGLAVHEASRATRISSGGWGRSSHDDVAREGGAGTVGYAAPEQARGDAVTPRADVYALGCVICECMLGEKPFAAETDVAVIARMIEGDTTRITARLAAIAPDTLVRVVARMLSSDPAARPRDGAAVSAELGAIEVAVSSRNLPSSRSVTNAETRGSQVLVAITTAAASVRLHEEIAALGGRLNVRDDGPLVCAWSTESSAVERAVRGARAALAVRRSDVHARASLVASTSDETGIDAAFEALPPSPALRIDADTARLIGDRFVVRPESDGEDLVLLRESASPHSRTSMFGRETRCIGRDREIGLIVSVFDEAASEPDARVVWITGAPGIGKTRVRDEVLERIRRSAATVWSAQCDPTRSGVALEVIAELVRSAASIVSDDADEHQHAALAARVGAHIADENRARVVEFLSELLRLPIAAPSEQLLAARQEAILMSDQVRRAFHDFAFAELGAGPLAIVIEDLQWADAASITMISDLARVAHDTPLFALLIGRPEAKDTLLRLVAERQPTGVSLGKLGTKVMEKLVALALGAKDPSAPIVADIAARAGGNPFYAEELVRAAQAGTQRATAALAMVEARLSSLEPEARRVLRAASVFGPQFSSTDVAALLGEAAPPKSEAPSSASESFVDAWCSWLAEREVLTQSGATWSFRHALVRDAAYGMLTDVDRRTAHSLAAELLESSSVPRRVIAEHWLAADEPVRASKWLAISAADALEANDLAACIDLGERALATLTEPARGSLLVVLAEAHRWRGGYDRAIACSREAITVLPIGGALFFRAVAELAAMTGTVTGSSSNEEFESAIAKLEATPVDAAATTAASMAWSRAAMQLLVRSDDRADALLARAEIAADTDLARGRVEQGYALRAEIRGAAEDILVHYAAAVSALERAGDVRGACVQELNLASALCEVGQDARARERVDHGAREAEARGLLSAIALAHHLDGILLARENRDEDATLAQRRALETFAAQGNARMEGGVRCYLAELLLRRNKIDEALAEATRSCALLASAPPARARATAVLAMIHIARGDVSAALAASADAIAIAEKGGVESGEAVVYRVRADALALAQSPEAEAVREIGRGKLRARAQAIGDPALRESMLRVPENAQLLDARPIFP